MFQGIYPPLPTPFRNDEIAFDKLQLNIEKLNSTGLRGYVTLGSNGEFAFLTREEKLKVIKLTKEAASKEKLIFAGTGSDSIKETIFMTNEAAKLGADAVLVLTPSYYKSQMNNKALINYFTQVADNAGIPVLIYNVPKFTGIDIAPQAVAELAAHKNIKGIKNSSENIVHLTEIINAVPENFTVLTGTGSVIYAGVTAGAKGGIVALANVAPGECVDILNFALNGQTDKALQIQKRLLDLNKAVTAKYGVAGLKYAMDLTGYAGGEVRAPLNPLTSKEKEEIESVVSSALN